MFGGLGSFNGTERLGITPLRSTLTLKPHISIDCDRASKSLNKTIEKLGYRELLKTGDLL
jgi:hypothetical protein